MDSVTDKGYQEIIGGQVSCEIEYLSQNAKLHLAKLMDIGAQGTTFNTEAVLTVLFRMYN